MNVFENCSNSNQQGALGEARAILEYSEMGYVVLQPIFSTKYDLVIEKDGRFQRVQVKTSATSCRFKGGRYEVVVDTRVGARGVYRHRKDEDYDLLFVLVADGRVWSIPTSALEAKTKITIGNTKYNEYILNNGAIA